MQTPRILAPHIGRLSNPPGNCELPGLTQTITKTEPVVNCLLLLTSNKTL